MAVNPTVTHRSAECGEAIVKDAPAKALGA